METAVLGKILNWYLCSIDDRLMKPFTCIDKKKSWSLPISTGGRVKIKGRWYEVDDDRINCFIRWRALRTRIRNEGVADISEEKFAGRLGGKNHPNDWLEKSIMAFFNTESKNKPPAWPKKQPDFYNCVFLLDIVGNYCRNPFKNSEEPASFLLRNLSPTLQSISSWQASMIIDSKSKSVQTLPLWLQDVLVNWLSFWRSGLYLRDGRWQQFESLDCIDIDSVHNDLQREIPYVLLYPDLVENVMRAWAKY